MREFSDSFMGDGCWVRSASNRSARAKENDMDELLIGSKRSWRSIGRCLLEHEERANRGETTRKRNVE